MFLSVIIPVYNTEKYLKKCFDSIRMQKFCDYEVIVVDDGSTDKSPFLCDEYAQDDERVKIYHIENGGASHARNLGFQYAKGEYIYCLDCDDYFNDEEYFTKIYDSLKNNPVDILQTGATYVTGLEEQVNKILSFDDNVDINVEQPYKTIEYLIRNGKYEVSCWTKVIRRGFLIEKKVFFDETLLIEDVDWNMRFVSEITTYNLLPCSSYVHVYREGSITSSGGVRDYKICLDYASTLKKWCEFWEKYEENETLRISMLSYLCYQFFIVLGKCSVLTKEQRKDVSRKLKEIDFITCYAIERKQQYMKVVYRVGGYNLASIVLGQYYKYFRTRVRRKRNESISSIERTVG